MNDYLLELKNAGKIYNSEGNVAVGIRGINCGFNLGEFVVITGSSGSGKSTLLNVLSGLTTIQEGEMFLNGEDVTYFDNDDYEAYRKNYVAFIFQNFSLVDSYTVYENIELSLIAKGVEESKRKELVLDFATKVGLKDKLKERVVHLSGGQKQRASIARALASDAPILACDEITGNLDHETSVEIIELLSSLAEDKLILMVTHDPDEVISHATRLITMQDGSIVKDQKIRETKSIASPVQEEHVTFKKDNFKLAFRSLLRTPKKTILIFLILLIAITLIGLLLSTITKDDGYSFYGDYNDKEVLIKKCDKSPITTSEMEAMKSEDGVAEVNNNLFINRFKWFVSDYEYMYANGEFYFGESYCLSNVSNLKSHDLISGRLPVSDKEIVLSGSDLNALQAMIGRTIFMREYSENICAKYTVTGIVESLDSNLKCYLTGNEIKKFEASMLVNSVMLSEAVDNAVSYFVWPSWGYVAVDDSLENNTVLTNKNVNDSNSLSYSRFGESAFISNVTFKTLTESDYDAYVASGLIDETFLDAPGYSSTYTILSKDIYSKLLETGNDEIQVLFKDSIFKENQINNFIDKYNEAGYYALYNYEDNTDFFEVIDIVVNIIIYVLCFGITMLVYLLSHLSLRNIMLSEKDDFVVMKSLGIKTKDIKKQIYIQMGTVAAFVSILFVVFVIVMKSIIIKNDSFLYRFHTMQTSEILITIMLIATLVILLSRRFGKDIFEAETTAKNSR